MSKIKVILLLLLIVFFAADSYSQFKSKEKDSEEDPMNKILGRSGTSNTGTSINADAPDLFSQLESQNTFKTKTVPIEGAIDADKYFVGPNDLFTLGLYGYINQQVPIVVSPVGSVIIPTVGEVIVDGLSLNEASAKVISAVKKRYYSSDVSFTLNTPRTFLIKVSGLTQGTFEVSPVTRVSEILKVLIFDTLNTSRVYYEKTNEREFLNTQISLRNIELFRKDGTVKKVDVYKYFLTNNDEHNPFFLEGDLLKIPYLQLDNNFITVSGAVQLAGSYEHVEGDDLETAIGIARGFDVNAEPDSIQLYRPFGNLDRYDVLNLEFDKDKDFKINKFDRLFVKYKINYQKNLSVLILGEVLRPGYYPISFKNTRLKDVIEMAGGLRDKAYLPLSILFRTYDAEYAAKDSSEIMINSRANDLLISDADRVNFATDIKSKRNRVIVDFEKLIEKNDESQNVLLEGKDIIYINDNKNIVYVYGQVGQEGYVPYKKGEDVDYYINKAGGYGLAADDDNTRVIKFNSRGWYLPEETEILSGDFVYVPKVVEETFGQTVAIIAQIAGVILGVLTTYILIKQNQ
ncbi:MAG: SLBB domain-containing protein [Ignavibacteria bacterium]|nr:SLBB domain-containing protein [Ignavibacteria bacterium]